MCPINFQEHQLAICLPFENKVLKRIFIFFTNGKILCYSCLNLISISCMLYINIHVTSFPLYTNTFYLFNYSRKCWSDLLLLSYLLSTCTFFYASTILLQYFYIYWCFLDFLVEQFKQWSESFTRSNLCCMPHG